MSQTDLILHRHTDLICDCDVCRRVMGKDPDKIIHFVDNPELLRKHFLTVRKQEMVGLDSSSAQVEAKKFRAAYSKYNVSFSALPNPDAIVANTMIQGINYLRIWADSITAPL